MPWVIAQTFRSVRILHIRRFCSEFLPIPVSLLKFRLLLKFVDQIISRNDFDVEILDGSNGLNEELIEKLLTKYNMKINLADESSETE